MLVVISPAKSLDFENPAKTQSYTQPEFLKESQVLIALLRELTSRQLSDLMGLSDKLLKLNQSRYQKWHLPFNIQNAKQAIFAFNGDVYEGLEAESLSEKELTFAQTHLRILSGLYGVLCPLDLIQAYRLEMGTMLGNPLGKDLYAFWGEKITHSLNQQLKNQKDAVLVNLASEEYFKVIKPTVLQASVITPVFKDKKQDQYKVISFYAKKARGLMARYIIQNRLKKVEEIKQFNVDGYYFDHKQSSEKKWVFLRDHT